MHCYETLEIPATADAATIRAAYRRLVLLTHPDRTADPAAHARYLAVNAAYETLGNAARRQAYDRGLAQPTAAAAPAAAPNPTWGPGRQRDEARVSRPVPRRSATEQRLGRYAHIYLLYSGRARRLNVAILAFGLLIGLDYFCALEYADEPVLSNVFYVVHGRRRTVTDSYYQIETPNTSFRANADYELGERLTMRRTFFFRQVLSHRPSSARPGAAFNNAARTIYSPLAVLPLAMLLAAVVGAWPGRISRRPVEAGIMAAVLAVMVLFVLARN